MTQPLIDSKELERKLNRLADDVAADTLANAAEVGAKVIENEWEDLMLQDPTTYKTGQYRRSVTTEVAETSRDQAEVHVFTDIDDPPYPNFLEFGTSKMKARPKARPAFDNKKDEAVKEVRKALADLIRKALR